MIWSFKLQNECCFIVPKGWVALELVDDQGGTALAAPWQGFPDVTAPEDKAVR